MAAEKARQGHERGVRVSASARANRQGRESAEQRDSLRSVKPDRTKLKIKHAKRIARQKAKVLTLSKQ